MTSSTSFSSASTSKTSSFAQATVSSTTSTFDWIIPEESLAIFANGRLPDYYYEYSQDSVDVMSLFLGVSAFVYLIGYIASLLILRHRRNRRKAWRDAMTEYYHFGGIPPCQTGGVATYINGVPNPPDVDINPYHSQPCAPYMSRLHRIQPSSSSDEPLMVYRPRAPATLSQVNTFGSEVPTAVASPDRRPLEIAEPPATGTLV